MDTKQHDFIKQVIYQEKSSHCFTNNKIVFSFTENCNNPSKKKDGALELYHNPFAN